MGLTVIAASGTGVTSYATNTTQGLSTSDVFDSAGASEAINQMAIGANGEITKFAVNSIKTPGDMTLLLRVNGADATGTVSTTGVQLSEDTTHTDAVVAGDLVTSKATSTASTPTLAYVRALFRAGSGHVQHHGAATSSTGRTASAGTTYYAGFSFVLLNTTEAVIKQRVRVAGAFSKLRVYATGATTGSATVRVRVNGADGNGNVTITAGVTGAYSDTTNSDTVAAGDDVCLKVVGGSTGNTTLRSWGLIFTATSGQKSDLFSNLSTTTRSASGTANYYNPVGANSSNTTEANRRFCFGYACAISRIRVYISANTYSANATLKSRVTGADGAQSVTITAGVTGLYEDTTNSDTLASTDHFALSLSGGTSGSITHNWFGVTVEDTAPHGDASVTLGALATSAAGAVAVQGAATPTLGALTTSATGSVAVQGSATVSLGAMTVASAGAVAVQGSATPTLDALTLLADGGQIPDVGVLAVTLDSLALAADGIVVTNGVANITLGAATVAATGVVAVQGSASIALGAVAVASAGVVAVRGDASITLGNLPLASAGVVAVKGAAAIALGALTLTGAGAVAVRGVASITLGALSVASIATFPRLGDASITLGALALGAHAAHTFIGRTPVTTINYAGASAQQGLTFIGKTSSDEAH